MKISLLSGAYKNAGDYLIVNRCKELILNRFPSALIKDYERKYRLDDYIDEINKSDVIVLGGGPAYVPYIYPGIMPLMNNLERIRVPIFAMCMGQCMDNNNLHVLYGTKFTKDSIKLLKRIEGDGFSLGCRDFYSEKLLNLSGINNTMMTGCSAWYDLNYTSKNCLEEEINKIYVSDPAQYANYQQFLDVLFFLRLKFPEANISVVFHRDQSKYLCVKLEEMGISYFDISGSAEGIKKYDDCDLHVGYRVHAHIYNLSHRKKSILIEEDARGFGVNDALGLCHITAYDKDKCISSPFVQKLSKKMSIPVKRSKYVCDELDTYIQCLKNNDYLQLKCAFKRMDYFYHKMKEHIEQLKRLED